MDRQVDRAVEQALEESQRIHEGELARAREAWAGEFLNNFIIAKNEGWEVLKECIINRGGCLPDPDSNGVLLPQKAQDRIAEVEAELRHVEEEARQVVEEEARQTLMLEEAAVAAAAAAAAAQARRALEEVKKKKAEDQRKQKQTRRQSSRRVSSNYKSYEFPYAGQGDWE